MRSGSRRRRLVALCFAALLGLSAVLVVEASAAASIAYGHFRTARSAFDAEIAGALQGGFTSSDLGSIPEVRASLEIKAEPVWVAARVSFYEHLTSEAEQGRDELRAVEQKAMETAVAQSQGAVQQARDRVAEDARLGAEPADMAPLEQALDTLARGAASARTLKDHQLLTAQAQNVIQRASDVSAAIAAENNAVAQSGRELAARLAGNLDAIRRAAREALYTARNEAAMAGFLKLDSVSRPYNLLERYAPMVEQPAADQATLGAGAVLRYAAQLHSQLMASMPKHTIVVNLSIQNLYAYDSGRVILDTPVTTGKPELPTDVGRMSVLWKVAPWTMHSPWPKTSPHYYPDTKVRKVVWFTNSGEGFHDASWRSYYGPGTNLDGSHGCVNMPGTTVDVLYDWAQTGDAVVVMPGDGSRPADQLKQDTISDPALANAPKGA